MTQETNNAVPSGISAEDLELDAATRALKAAQERKAKLEKARVDQAMAAAAEERARREKAAADETARRMRIEEEWRAKRAQQEEERKAAQKAQESQEENLRKAADELRLQEQARLERETRAREIAEEAKLLEMENNRIAAELVSKSQVQPIPVSPADGKVLPLNENLAFAEVVRGAGAAERDTEGRLRLFNRSASGVAPDYNADPPNPAVAQVSAEVYRLPAEYCVVNGRISAPVFSKLFGPEHSFALFISGQDGTLCANGYRWKIDGIPSRNFYHGCQCVIEQLGSGEYALCYTAQHSGHKERVVVTPVEPDPLFHPEPLNTDELSQATAVDSQEELLGEAHGE